MDIEKQIEEARKRGDFDDLPGQGKPLRIFQDISNDPALAQTNQVLADAGYAPDWVDIIKSVDRRMNRLREQIHQHLDRHRAQKEAIIVAAAAGTSTLQHAGNSGLAESICRDLLAHLQEEIAAINKDIDRYNLLLPVAHKQRHRSSLENRPKASRPKNKGSASGLSPMATFCA